MAEVEGGLKGKPILQKFGEAVSVHMCVLCVKSHMESLVGRGRAGPSRRQTQHPPGSRSWCRSLFTLCSWCQSSLTPSSQAGRGAILLEFLCWSLPGSQGKGSCVLGQLALWEVGGLLPSAGGDGSSLLPWGCLSFSFRIFAGSVLFSLLYSASFPPPRRKRYFVAKHPDAVLICSCPKEGELTEACSEGAFLMLIVFCNGCLGRKRRVQLPLT